HESDQQVLRGPAAGVRHGHCPRVSKPPLLAPGAGAGLGVSVKCGQSPGPRPASSSKLTADFEKAISCCPVNGTSLSGLGSPGRHHFRFFLSFASSSGRVRLFSCQALSRSNSSALDCGGVFCGFCGAGGGCRCRSSAGLHPGAWQRRQLRSVTVSADVHETPPTPSAAAVCNLCLRLFMQILVPPLGA
uniref:Secreted protein n=1 Tax=Macrostomum lignano TaxID=282301 RepID=A0A1I8FM91_9PLAT